jgi:hypothetical protein
LNQRLLRLARILTFLVAIFLSLRGVALYLLTAQVVLNDPGTVVQVDSNWTGSQIEIALAGLGLPHNFYTIYSLFMAFVFSSVFLACGWLILLRKNQDWFGLYLALLLIGWSNGFGAFISLPQVAVLETIDSLLSWSYWPGIFLLFYLFPSGHITPRWARWFAWGWVFFSVYGLVSSLLNALPEEFIYFIPLLIAVLLVGGYSQVYRFHHAGGVEKQQIKWVVTALLFMAVIFISMLLLVNLTGLADPSPGRLPQALAFDLIFSTLGNLVFIGVPISIALAIFRFRLWDVDILIRKTLVYGLLSATLALLYFGLVTLLQSLSASVFGLRSPVVVVLSTLILAALFNPMRRRIQDFIDRRFYRKKYDAEKALAQFAEAARNETDIQCLNEALIEVVQETMQPERVSLWIQKQARR